MFALTSTAATTQFATTAAVRPRNARHSRRAASVVRAAGEDESEKPVVGDDAAEPEAPSAAK